jgi:hypothetical protein
MRHLYIVSNRMNFTLKSVYKYVICLGYGTEHWGLSYRD